MARNMYIKELTVFILFVTVKILMPEAADSLCLAVGLARSK